MKYQIISRAFYGCEYKQPVIVFTLCENNWIVVNVSSVGLAYCRHLSTVRTHLSALVNTSIVDPDVPADARGGLSVEVWDRILKDSSVRFKSEHLTLNMYFPNKS